MSQHPVAQRPRAEQPRRTLVSFHAHPDDEALLTSGTLAKVAAAGHRVVLVVATDGSLGRADEGFRVDGLLAQRRMAELRASADALGVEEVIHLGYADSGMVGEIPPDLPASSGAPAQQRFCRAPVEEAADKLAEILTRYEADVLTSYDAAGGYGHRDHVRVHEVAMVAAARAGTPKHLQATVPRDLIARAVQLAAKVYPFPADFDPTSFARAYSPRAQITHRIDVHRHIAAKRASMAAHASQAQADEGGDRTLGVFLKVPRPLYDMVFGREWYVDAAASGSGRIARDVFDGL